MSAFSNRSADYIQLKPPRYSSKEGVINPALLLTDAAFANQKDHNGTVVGNALNQTARIIVAADGSEVALDNNNNTKVVKFTVKNSDGDRLAPITAASDPVLAIVNAVPTAAPLKHRSGGIRSIISMPQHSTKGFTRIGAKKDDNSCSSGSTSSSAPKIFIPKVNSDNRASSAVVDLYDEEAIERYGSNDGNGAGMVGEETPLRRRQDIYSAEYGKTLLAFFFLFLSTMTGSFVIAYINRYSVSQGEPLPDLVFNLVPQQTWAWEVADVTVIVCPLFTLLVLLFHKHNSIAFRRLCVLASVLYLLRAIFLLCTYLPPPFQDFKSKCLPANFTDNTVDFFKTTFALVFRVGFSSDENQIMCGDTIYSGHAMIFTLVCLTLRYYTPNALSPYPLILLVVGSVLGMVCVIISRQHYTIDVVVAIVVTCAVFYGHRSWTMQSRVVRCFDVGPPRRCRPLFYLFLIFESKVPRGPLPAELAWPFAGPAFCVRSFERFNERSAASRTTAAPLGSVDSRAAPKQSHSFDI